MDEQIRKNGISAVGKRYAIFGVVVSLLQIATSTVFQKVAPDFLNDHYAMISFLMIIVTMDMIGLPMVYLLTKKLDYEVLPKSDLGVGNFVKGIFICAAITAVGAIIGMVVNLAFTLPFGIQPNDTSAISKMMFESGFFMRVLTVAILAPIVEELIFRKLLIDHLVKYGKVVAIVASGLSFGLFHGNFSQCFFAAGLGIFFAIIYIKTGKIRYTIGYHMIVNGTTSIITLAFAKPVLEANTPEMLAALSAGNSEVLEMMIPRLLMFYGWIGVLGACAIVGVILFILNIKKYAIQENEGALSVSQSIKAVITNPGMLLFYLLCVVLFMESYLLPIIKK